MSNDTLAGLARRLGAETGVVPPLDLSQKGRIDAGVSARRHPLRLGAPKDPLRYSPLMPFPQRFTSAAERPIQNQILANTFAAAVAAIHVESVSAQRSHGRRAERRAPVSAVPLTHAPPPAVQGFHKAREFCRDFVLHTFERVDVSSFVKLESHPKNLLARFLEESGSPPLRFECVNGGVPSLPFVDVSCEHLLIALLSPG